MNYYIILPLVAFIANILLGLYVLYRNSKSPLNKIYSFYAFSLAVWALGDVITFDSLLSGTDLGWVDVGIYGSFLTPAFLLHFCLVFSKRKIISKKIHAILLYLPALFFIIVSHATDLLYGAKKTVYWGYTTEPGSLYLLVLVYIVGYIIISIFFIYIFYKATKSAIEKRQATLINIAIAIPLIGGIITEAIPPILGFEIVPLSTTLTTITAVFIAYAILKYGLMASLNFSIKRKLIAAFFTLIMFICIVSVFAVNTVSRDALENQLCAHLETTAESRADHIKTIIDVYKQYAETLATGNAFRDARKNYTESINRVNRRINSTLESNKAISRVRVLDKNGIIIASSHNDTGLDKSNHEIFLEGKEGTYIGEIHISDFTSKVVISVSSPIFVNDTFSGVIVINFDADKELFKVTSEYEGLGETGEVYLVNKDGYMITPSRFKEDTVLKQKVDSEQYRICLSEHIEGSLTEEMHELPTTCPDYRGCRVVGIHYYISEIQCCLLVEIDEKEAFAQITTMQNTIITIFIAIGIVSLIFAYYFAESITKPIIKLKDNAKIISKGNFDIKIDTKSKDEIGELAIAFTNMTADLKKQQTHLEDTVDERTKILKENIEELKTFKKVVVGRELKMTELKEEIKRLKEILKNKTGDSS